MNAEYQHNRRAPLSTLANYSLDVEHGHADAPLKVLVVDRRGNFSHDIERAARSLEQVPKVVTIAHPTHLLEEVALESPDVVLAAPEEMTATGLKRLAQVHRAAPKTVIALTQGTAPLSMTDAAASGASEVIHYPASVTKLRNALSRILDTAAAVRGERVVIREVQTPAPPGVAPAPPVAAPAMGTARVFTVTSPTGGCGKTFFATNLAAYLAGATGGRVLLVDLDLQFGEVSLALGLRPQRTISELINEENMLEAFGDYLVEHSSGYKVLSAPADPFAAELVGPREATQVLECARTLFDYVVVDTPPSLNEVVLAAFDQSRYLVVMATLDVPSLRNLRVFLETIERLKLPADDVSCVLNKAEPDNGIDLQELLRVYPRGFAAVLPYSKEVSRSLNVGQPVLMVDPRAEISLKLLEAGAKLVPAAEVINPQWGRSGGWSSRSSRRRDRHNQAPALAPVAAPAPTRPVPVPVPVPQAVPAPEPVVFQAPPEAVAQPEPARPAAQAQPPAAPAGTWTPPPVLTWRMPVVATTAVGGPSGLPAHEQTPRRSWLSRLFGNRRGRHSASGFLETPNPRVSTAAQMQVGPQEFQQAGRNDQAPARDTEAPHLVFAGSREAPTSSEADAGQAAARSRRRPNDSPSINSWKEPRR